MVVFFQKRILMALCFFGILPCFFTKTYGAMTPEGIEKYIGSLRRQPGFRSPPEWFLGEARAAGRQAEKLQREGNRTHQKKNLEAKTSPDGGGPKDS